MTRAAARGAKLVAAPICEQEAPPQQEYGGMEM